MDKAALGALEAARVTRPVPLRQVVYDALAELIINRTLRAGQHLVEADLAEHLGVSRQPIREALQRLQAEGWVDLRPGQGAFVHTPTDEEADELFGVRTVLEAYAARLAAERATSAAVARLLDLQNEGLAALSAGDTDRLVAANAALHAFVVDVAGNSVLRELMGGVARRVRWYHTPVAQLRGKDSWLEHAELIEAIGNNDADAAEAVMTRHTERTRRAFHERSTQD
ncbi:DNA-binding transcriptional regulator, GntR family [Actinokineospora alba]|uniref:DNA-binding transcriptional regulator, GntR family n=1 Tax=Actinokineospora alba TaxID=504798 RepID=A0A1H0LVK8_9PSEU|nr:GntR family transcriptional regulator [Actinokineospora alba]TDP67467.1 DNA-binding GntR family transcriptional regulator [Actinokineospora alba]SDI95659.1 DNA-binding transcriptional regulator, GntR family [Actinokineospora alba]SDO71950.1 DNA-binding transcriptional regulator, GntR family [Actinokineospora alba]